MATNLAVYLEGRAIGSLVYVGSDAVYGFDDEVVTEETPVAPIGYYALGKYAAERVMDCAARAASVPLLVLRVTGVYGPGDPHASYGPNAFARSLARDHSVRIFGAGEEERDHVYIDDVARVTSDFVQNGTTGVFNVATGQSWSFGELIKVIRDLVPYPVEVTSVPRKGAITHRRFDVSRLTRTLPELRFTALREGLRTTLAAAGALPDA
jgi:UDP-glucose 4-epimerase